MSLDQSAGLVRSDDGVGAASSARAIVVGILAALAGLMFGLDTGVIAGALGFIGDEFHAGARMQEWIVSSMMAAAALGSMAAGRISFHFGRRRALLGASLLFLAGSVACALAPSISVLIAGRVLLGLAVGIAAFAAPLYISEITVEAVRGAMVSFYQLMVTLGIFLAYVTDSLLSYGAHWRWMLGLMAVPAALFCLGCAVLPDSPRWLMMRGDSKRARQVMLHLRRDPTEADAEIRDIAQELRKPGGNGGALFWTNANFRRSVMLGVALQIMQQLTGINVLMYYAPKIFQAAHFGVSASTWATALLGLINMASTGFAIAFIDRWGRRPLLILSCAIMTAAMLGAGGLMMLGGDSLAQQIGMVAALLTFVAGFAIGAGPLVWTLCAEIQPLRGRDFGIACSTFTNWAANWLISNVFLTMMAALGEAVTFGLFALMNGLFVVITLLYVPETRGVSLEEIEARLMSGRRLRDLGR
ncbi:sugar porter family MFS transporter [Nguyenibacter vanlangensis]|uniref:Sugar porter family MFS transporter n=1 Tax=Nguyenibacter vanlangensis TaxID=1216886 RepID=A0ABZ3D5K3_9PROT